MYAIVDLAGQQMKVEKDQKVIVHSLKGEEGSMVEFDQVLLLENYGTVSVGTPVIEGAKVTATIINHLRGDKVLVFKKKRRKGYQKMTGHRQNLTRILIENIAAKAARQKKADKKEETETEE